MAVQISMYKPRGQGWVGHHRRGKAHPIRAATGSAALHCNTVNSCFFGKNFHGGCRAERRSAGPNPIRPNYGPNNVRAKACHGHPARARAWPGWLWHAAGCGSAALHCNTVNSCFLDKDLGRAIGADAAILCHGHPARARA